MVLHLLVYFRELVVFVFKAFMAHLWCYTCCLFTVQHHVVRSAALGVERQGQTRDGDTSRLGHH